MRPILIMVLAVLAGFVLAVLIIVPAVNPPRQDLEQLFLLMGSTGGLTALITYVLYRRGAIWWFRSLRLTLLALILLTVLLIFVNVWLVARLMFINEHDLALITALLIFAGLIAAVAVFLISGTVIQRIRELASASGQVAHGNLTARLNVQGKDELAELARSFNSMAEALHRADQEKEKMEQARRDLIAWVSHDLRTPLAAIRAMNEAVLDGVVSEPVEVARYMRDMQRETQHLSRLIDDLFELSRLSSGHVLVTRQAVLLRDLISDTLSGWRARAEQAQVRLRGEVDDGVGVVQIAPDKIQRVLSNLLDNALEHTPPQGTITICAKLDVAGIAVSVNNTGSVIAATDLPHVFTSFYTGQSAVRTASPNGKRGTGLGLAIARGFVAAHGGTINVHSTEAQGTTFTFVLPAQLM